MAPVGRGGKDRWRTHERRSYSDRRSSCLPTHRVSDWTAISCEVVQLRVLSITAHHLLSFPRTVPERRLQRKRGEGCHSGSTRRCGGSSPSQTRRVAPA